MAVALAKGPAGKPILHVELMDHGALKKLDTFARSLRVLGGWKAEITSDSPYIGFVTEGTRAHVIRPRNVRALFWPGARHPVASVNHPGTRANPFVQRAFDSRAGELAARAVTELERGFNASNPRAGEQAAQLAANVLLGEVRRQAPYRSGDLQKSLRARFRRGG